MGVQVFRGHSGHPSEYFCVEKPLLAILKEFKIERKKGMNTNKNANKPKRY